MNKHTPAPWYDDGYRFNEADAALIRAAPELLAALEMIADMQDDPSTMRVKAREAIAKVRSA